MEKKALLETEACRKALSLCTISNSSRADRLMNAQHDTSWCILIAIHGPTQLIPAPLLSLSPHPCPYTGTRPPSSAGIIAAASAPKTSPFSSLRICHSRQSPRSGTPQAAYHHRVARGKRSEVIICICIPHAHVCESGRHVLDCS